MQREPSADFDRFVLDRSTALLRTAVLLVGDVGHAIMAPAKSQPARSAR
ncbi:hypothetical protein ACFOWZ_33725 [Lentzea rhizosphaerae]|uniref:Uncharacterized protein n=1 Tax=Lentzea rhizosphaerae TaxID=2041025 RepID=A0ABV8C3D2_9PSEU